MFFYSAICVIASMSLVQCADKIGPLTDDFGSLDYVELLEDHALMVGNVSVQGETELEERSGCPSKCNKCWCGACGYPKPGGSCSYWCSRWNWCHYGDQYKSGGTDCRGCAIDPCTSSPCLHGGQCKNLRLTNPKWQTEDGDFECTCTNEWTGAKCETRKACKKNDGNIGDGTTQGTCPDGKLCFNDGLCKKFDACDSSPCKNGGTCRSFVSTYQCKCPDGWIGDQCQTNCGDASHCKYWVGVEEYKCKDEGNQNDCPTLCSFWLKKNHKCYKEICRTKDDKDSVTGMPPNPNAPCHFPFNWNGKIYNECTKDDHSQKWCGTKVDVVGNPTMAGVTDGWGNCEETKICGNVAVPRV